MKFEWRSYQRPFSQPLRTAHGEWRDRSGILLKLTADGRVGYGEIAPLPEFGSETLAAALTWCEQMPVEFSEAAIATIPDTLPACQFGFESAWENLTEKPCPRHTPDISALLPAGKPALTAWKPLWEAGYRTFKWKIAVTDLLQEIEWFLKLRHALPEDGQLRLDANGGLTPEQAATWLEVCDRHSIEYLEQPLPPSQLQEMLALQSTFATAIALDESVATLQHLQHCLETGWRGVVVIKPAIAGSPAKLRQLCHQHTLDLVFSSVFETAIGRQAGLGLAAALGNPDRAVGYGTTQWFDHEMHDFDEL